MVSRFRRHRPKTEQEPEEGLRAPPSEAEDGPGVPEATQPAEASETNEPAEAAGMASPSPSPVEIASRDTLSLLSTLLRLHAAEDTVSLTDAAGQLAHAHLDGTHLLVLLADKGGSFRPQSVKPAATQRLVEQLNDALGIDLARETPPPYQGRMAKIWLEDTARPQVVSLADLWGGPAGVEACQQAEKALGISQVTAVRLASPDEPLGIAIFLSCGRPPDSAMLDAIGRHLTVAVANLRSVEKARQFGSIDPIRWIPDRREFARQLSREANRARRYSHPLSVVLLVVDNFDTLRVEYGWTVANRLLRAASSTLAECLRESDLLGSYCHNGFAVILAQTSAEAASEAADRLRESAAGVRVLEGEGGPVPECIVATASYPEDGSDATAILVAAESRLLPKRHLSSATA